MIFVVTFSRKENEGEFWERNISDKGKYQRIQRYDYWRWYKSIDMHNTASRKKKTLSLDHQEISDKNKKWLEGCILSIYWCKSHGMVCIWHCKGRKNQVTPTRRLGYWLLKH